jgi:hypothetical protein
LQDVFEGGEGDRVVVAAAAFLDVAEGAHADAEGVGEGLPLPVAEFDASVDDVLAEAFPVTHGAILSETAGSRKHRHAECCHVHSSPGARRRRFRLGHYIDQ